MIAHQHDHIRTEKQKLKNKVGRSDDRGGKVDVEQKQLVQHDTKDDTGYSE